MLASPRATPVAIPELLMVTTVLALDAQVTWDVQSPLVPSEYWQVTVYCCDVSAGNDITEGVTTMLCREEEVLVPTVILPVPAALNVSTPAVSVVPLAGAPAPEIV